MARGELKNIIDGFQYLAWEAAKAGYPEVGCKIERLISEIEDGGQGQGPYAPRDLRCVLALLRKALATSQAAMHEALGALEQSGTGRAAGCIRERRTERGWRAVKAERMGVSYRPWQEQPPEFYAYLVSVKRFLPIVIKLSRLCVIVNQ